MKKTITIIALFAAPIFAFAQKDTTHPKQQKPDSVDVMPDKFKMELSSEDINILIANIEKEIDRLVARRQKLIEQASKQVTKKAAK